MCARFKLCIYTALHLLESSILDFPPPVNWTPRCHVCIFRVSIQLIVRVVNFPLISVTGTRICWLFFQLHHQPRTATISVPWRLIIGRANAGHNSTDAARLFVIPPAMIKTRSQGRLIRNMNKIKQHLYPDCNYGANMENIISWLRLMLLQLKEILMFSFLWFRCFGIY